MKIVEKPCLNKTDNMKFLICKRFMDEPLFIGILNQGQKDISESVRLQVVMLGLGTKETHNCG